MIKVPRENTGTIYLKVKLKSLAAEAKIIRDLENKPENKAFKDSLSYHRKLDVRREARATLLAYAFLRGKNYRDVERKTYEEPNTYRVGKLVDKYGVRWTGPDSKLTREEVLEAKKEQDERIKNWFIK